MRQNHKEQNTIIRTNKRENPYVMIDKFGLNDDRLSWKAKGLLAYLLSKPDDWQIYERELVKRSTDGRDAVRTGLRELEKYGYMSRRQLRNEDGSFSGMEYIVYERPIEITESEAVNGISVDVEQPQTENPSTGNPTTENPPLLNNDITKTELTMIDCMDASAKIAAAAEPDPIYESLMKYVPSNCYVEGSPLTTGYILEIYLMLVNQFQNRLDTEVVRIACELYFERACRIEAPYGVIMKTSIQNPVGYFRWCYEDAIKQYKASRSSRSSRNK